MKKTIQPASFTMNAGDSATSYKAAGMLNVVQMRRTRLGMDSVIPDSDLLAPDNDLAIKDVKAWILHEPVSKRAYTVVKIQTNSGMIGSFDSELLHSTNSFSGSRTGSAYES